MTDTRVAMKKVLFTSARSWTNETVIERAVLTLVEKWGYSWLLIQGGAPGVDRIAGNMALKHNVHTAIVPALWELRGRGAGPQRNRIMLGLEPDLVLGFHWDLRDSKGTADCLKKAEQLGITTKLVIRDKLVAMPEAGQYYADKAAKKR